MPLKIQPAFCSLKQAIIPIDLIYSGPHDLEIDKAFIGFRNSEEVTIRVRRPQRHEYKIMQQQYKHDPLQVLQKWILLHGDALYRKYLRHYLQFVIVEIWELDE